jgi:hypothetical protein
MRALAVWTALMMSIVSVGWADHVPEWQMSTKRPERSLAGIQVGRTSIDAARKILGEPTRFQDLPEYHGEAEYVWEKPGLQVVLGTIFDPGNRTAKTEIVYSAPESTTFTFIFRNETEFSASLSDEGKIIALVLIASVE